MEQIGCAGDGSGTREVCTYPGTTASSAAHSQPAGTRFSTRGTQRINGSVVECGRRKRACRLGKFPEAQSEQQRVFVYRQECTRGRHAAALASYADVCYTCGSSREATAAGRQCPRLRFVAFISAQFSPNVRQRRDQGVVSEALCVGEGIAIAA